MNGPEAARVAQVSYRQLDTWVRKGWVPGMDRQGAGTGQPRPFSDEQVKFLRRMGNLVKAGMYPEKAHKIAEGNEDTILRLVLAMQPCTGAARLLFYPSPLAQPGADSPETPEVGQGAEGDGSGVSQN